MGESIAIYNMVCILFKIEAYQEAIENLQKALELFSKIDSNSVVNTLCKLAECYQILGNYKLALQYCEKGLEIANKFNLPSIKNCQQLQERLKNL